MWRDLVDARGRQLAVAARVAQQRREREELWQILLPAATWGGVLCAASLPGHALPRRLAAAMSDELQTRATLSVVVLVMTLALGFVSLGAGLAYGVRWWRARHDVQTPLEVRWLGRAFYMPVAATLAFLQPLFTVGVTLLIARGVARTAARDWMTAGQAGLAGLLFALALWRVRRWVRELDVMTDDLPAIPSTRWWRLVVFGVVALGFAWWRLVPALPGAVSCPAQVFVPGDVDTRAVAVRPTAPEERGATTARARHATRPTLVSFVVDTNGRPERASVGALVPGNMAHAPLVLAAVAAMTFRPARRRECPVRQLVVTEVSAVQDAGVTPAARAEGAPRTR